VCGGDTKARNFIVVSFLAGCAPSNAHLVEQNVSDDVQQVCALLIAADVSPDERVCLTGKICTTHLS
jgi:hypothetical protein